MSAAPTSAHPARPKLALAGTFTLEPLAPPLELVLASIGLELEVEVTPYAQVFQELLDPGRSFARNRGGVNAVLVPPDDPKALAHAIDQLAQDKELRLCFGRASRELVEREFATEKIGPATVALYEKLLSAPNS